MMTTIYALMLCLGTGPNCVQSPALYQNEAMCQADAQVLNEGGAVGPAHCEARRLLPDKAAQP